MLKQAVFSSMCFASRICDVVLFSVMFYIDTGVEQFMHVCICVVYTAQENFTIRRFIK